MLIYTGITVRVRAEALVKCTVSLDYYIYDIQQLGQEGQLSIIEGRTSIEFWFTQRVYKVVHRVYMEDRGSQDKPKVDKRGIHIDQRGIQVDKCTLRFKSGYPSGPSGYPLDNLDTLWTTGMFLWTIGIDKGVSR